MEHKCPIKKLHLATNTSICSGHYLAHFYKIANNFKINKLFTNSRYPDREKANSNAKLREKG